MDESFLGLPKLEPEDPSVLRISPARHDEKARQLHPDWDRWHVNVIQNSLEVHRGLRMNEDASDLVRFFSTSFPLLCLTLVPSRYFSILSAVDSQRGQMIVTFKKPNYYNVLLFILNYFSTQKL